MIGGIEVKCTCSKSKKEEGVYECVYVPLKQGQYIINITFGDQHIAKSPFKVEVGPSKTSKIRAYGPGLEGGVVNQPARFTVETQGETGALGKGTIRRVCVDQIFGSLLFESSKMLPTSGKEILKKPQNT